MSSGDHIRVRRAAALAFAIASTLAGARAGYAQTPNPTKDTQVIDVVIVTAQRREENLIDVPIAVAAFSGEALERRQIDPARTSRSAASVCRRSRPAATRASSSTSTRCR
jgi:outer membrane receptor protein involved in Fe transport